MNSKDYLVLTLVFLIPFLTTFATFPGLALPVWALATIVSLNAGAAALMAVLDPLKRRTGAIVLDAQRHAPRAPQAVQRDG